MRNILIALIITGLVIIASCGKTEPANPEPPATSKTEAPKAMAHKITDAEVGTEAVCPVMGTKVKVGKDTLASEYKGKVYYFCCGGCPDDFAKDPEKYIKK